MIELVCREAVMSDLEGVRSLLGELQDEEILPATDIRMSSAWQALLNSEFTTCFVAEYQERVISTMTLAVIPNLTRQARPFGVLQNVVTAEKNRGRGFGSRLWEYVAERAWSADCYQVLVQTSKPKALAWYFNLGFTEGKTGLMIKSPATVTKSLLSGLETPEDYLTA
jgi:N-acetylglutamate synthase-like GNAT family acetyltransferase